MKAKEFIQLFVPPVYYEVKQQLFPKKHPQNNPLPKVTHNRQRAVVIGNGPSLNKTMEIYKQQVLEADSIMVNESCMTPLYETIKPVAYVLVDPVYFEEEKNKHYLQTRIDVTKALVSKTAWPIKIIMPCAARGKYMTEQFKENPNIEVLYYESGWHLPKGISQFEALDKNLIDPPSQTVLNAALWLAIYWGYQETYIVGADTSFIQDIYVGQKDNVLYTIDTHFFNNEDVYDFDFEPEKHGRPFGMDMEELLKAVHTMFADYKKLRQYADWKGVKVYNASEYSMIDCFERKKL